MKLRRNFIAALAALILVSSPSWAQNPELRKELDEHFKKGLALREAGKHAESVPHFEKAAALAPQTFGADSLITAAILSTTGSANFHAGRMRAAEPFYRRTLEIRDAKLPKNDPKILESLNNLGVTLSNIPNYPEAEKILERLVVAQEQVSPKNDWRLALSHHNLGATYVETGKYQKAQTHYQKALDIHLANHGPNHPDVAFMLYHLADVYRRTGALREAEVQARRSLEIREAKLKPNDPLLAESLDGLGLILGAAGKTDEAERLLRRALEMRERVLGKNHPKVATTLNSLALLYGSSSREGEAEAYYRRALAIRETAFGRDHPAVAVVLNNLATHVLALGRHEEAERLWLRALQIEEAKLGKDHPDIASTLHNLGGLYKDNGRTKEAEAFMLRSIAITEGRLGKAHPQLGSTLNLLAVLYNHTGRPREAQELLKRSLAIQEQHYGKDNPRTAAMHHNLAAVYLKLNDFAQAEAAARRGVEILETAPTGRDLLIVLFQRAQILQALGRNAEALKDLDRCLQLDLANVRDIFMYSNEQAMYDFLGLRSGRLPMLHSVVAQSEDAAAAEMSLTWMLRFKGAVFDTLCGYRQIQQALARDDASRALLARYRNRKELVANYAVNPPTDISRERVAKLIEEAHAEAKSLEQELNRVLADKMPHVFAQRENASAAAVRKRLPQDAALVEFARMPVRDFKTQRWSAQHYFAYVVTPKGRTEWVDLGDAKEIEASIESLRADVIDFQDKLRDCDDADEATALEKKHEKIFAKKSAALYAQLFAPLRKALGDAKLLYLAPEYALNRLPFESLVDGEGKYLIERYRCAYLSSGRDLLRTYAKPAKGTVVFAGPDYKLEAAERIAQAEKLLPKKESSVELARLPARDVRSAGWKQLKGALAEAKDIQKALGNGNYGPVTSYVGAEALEEVLKAMPAPRVLHLATHGFFLDHEASVPEGDDLEAGAGSARSRLKRADNPLLRSGVVLAGANTVGDKEVKMRVEDGWVTAEEIALLHLEGTELVVLSACQTGLGDLKTGEGVYGLRRAFIYAGAQSLVTSLFEVPDAETRQLMQRFYAGLNRGEGKLRALHSAQRQLITERRETIGAAHPFFWASFVLVGNPD